MNYEKLNVNLLEFNKEFTQKSIYKRYNTSSTYIIMKDGVKIAIDIHIPENLPNNKKIPAVLVQTRYWRAMSCLEPITIYDRVSLP